MFPLLNHVHTFDKKGQALQQEAMDFGGSTCHILFTDTERQGHDCCSSWFLVLFSLLPLLLLLFKRTGSYIHHLNIHTCKIQAPLECIGFIKS